MSSRRDRSKSNTYQSNDVFYGDRRGNDANQFITESRLMSARKPANKLETIDGSPVKIFTKGYQSHRSTMSGILGSGNANTRSPIKNVSTLRVIDKATERTMSRQRNQLKQISDANREIYSQQIRQSTMQNFSEKKNISKLAKYLTNRDEIQALTLQNNRDRHTKHLKKDEVGQKTMELQCLQNAQKNSLQVRDSSQISFMETFTGDPIQRAFHNRLGSQSARLKASEKYTSIQQS